MSPIHYTTTDLYEAAYLMLCGCQIIGLNKLGVNCCSITFTYPKNISKTWFGFGYQSILDISQEYKSYTQVKLFAPRQYADKREELKRLIKSQPLE